MHFFFTTWISKVCFIKCWWIFVLIWHQLFSVWLFVLYFLVLWLQAGLPAGLSRDGETPDSLQCNIGWTICTSATPWLAHTKICTHIWILNFWIFHIFRRLTFQPSASCNPLHKLTGVDDPSMQTAISINSCHPAVWILYYPPSHFSTCKLFSLCYRSRFIRSSHFIHRWQLSNCCFNW